MYRVWLTPKLDPRLSVANEVKGVSNVGSCSETTVTTIREKLKNKNPKPEKNTTGQLTSLVLIGKTIIYLRWQVH